MIVFEVASLWCGQGGDTDVDAAAVAFLASADSSFMLGTTLHLNGGENQF